MQGSKIQTGQQAQRRNRIKGFPGKGKGAIPFLFVLLCLFLFLLAGTSSGAEKKPRKAPATSQKESSINDSNVVDYLKKGEEQLKKGETDASLSTLLRVHDYSEDVLRTIKYFKTQYEKVAGNSSVPQGEKEDILIKLKRIEQLLPRYVTIQERSAYDLGFAYAKKGEAEKSRKYLLEVLETAPFSTKNDSPWMKSKKLLLGLYNLEGEF